MRVKEDTDSRVHELLARAVAAGLFPGAVAMWGRTEGRQRCCVAGQADIHGTGNALSADTWFDLASLTKPLVTTTLAVLAFRDGVMTPDSTVGEVLPETRRTSLGDLVVHQLLTHSSGLPAWLPFYCLAEGQPARMSEVLQRIEVETRPGSQVMYSCVGFVVLGLMLENLADTDLDELFRNRVLSPLGLHEDLGFRPDPDRCSLAGGSSEPTAEERLVLERGLDPKWIPAVGRGLPDDGNSRFFGGAAGNAGLFGTARGVSLLTADFCRKTPFLFAPGEVEPAVTPQTTELKGQDRGWGWQSATTDGCSSGNAVPANGFGHTGFTGTSVWAEPDQGRIWVLLANRNHPGQRGIDLHPVRRRFHALAASAPHA